MAQRILLRAHLSKKMPEMNSGRASSVPRLYKVREVRIMKKALVLLVWIFLSSTSALAQPGAFRVNITYLNMKPWMKARVQNVVPVIERVMNSPEFRNAVLEYRSKSGKNEFEWNTGLTNALVLARIDEARELAYTGRPGEMDISISDYWRPSGTVGHTSPASSVIHLNRYQYKRMDDAGIASNLVHEWLHKIGFDHSFDWNPQRDDTVPYGVGSLVGGLVRQETGRY